MRKFEDFITEDGLRQQSFNDNGVVHTKITQDVEPFIEHNKIIRDGISAKEAHKKTIFKVGTIPAIVVLHFYKSGVNLYSEPNDTLLYILSSPKMKKFRCYNGKTRRPKIKNSAVIDKIIDELERIN